MSITTIGKQLIHYEVLGRGQPLIFIHGWLGSWRYWWPSMQALSARHRSFAFDLWGFGDSGKDPGNYSVSSYADMLDNFTNQLGMQLPVTLVGHALGAAVALRYAVRRPENVKKLVAVSLPIEGSKIHRRLKSAEPSDFIARVIGRSNSFPEIDSEVRKTDPVAVNRLADEMDAHNFGEELAKCTCPILTVYGEDDVVVQPPSGENHLLQSAKDGRFYVSLDDCRHFPMLQENAKFNRLLMDFIHADESLTELSPKEYWQRRVR
jgi:pimeloyl-ACP methyl ester carboxylesterase